MFTRKPLHLLAALCVAATLPLGALASDFPSKPIRFVVPYPPGGIADTISRAIMERLSARLGQPVIVENRPGGKQIIGTMAVTGAPADGHTLLLSSVTSLPSRRKSRWSSDVLPPAVTARPPSTGILK